MEPGKCCGTCKAVACIVITEDNTTHVLKVTNPVSVHFWWTISLFILVSITFTSHVFSHVRLMLIQMGWTVSRGLNSILSHEAEASGSNCDTEHRLSELKIKKNILQIYICESNVLPYLPSALKRQHRFCSKHNFVFLSVEEVSAPNSKSRGS